MNALLLHSPDDGPLPVRIGSTEIDQHSPPYLIAEAGVNHDGKLDQAKRLVDAAKEAGAHAVKFQMFSARSLVCTTAPSANYQTAAAGATTQRQLLEGLELSRRDFEQLQRCCRDNEITFLVTPFSVEDLRIAVDLDIVAIKIASTDLNNTPLLDAAIETNRPILLSTGASHLSEIDEAVSHMDQHEACDRLILLHCVSSYPTPPSSAALSTIASLRQRYGTWTGYSDHTTIVETAGLAVACGAKVLEKHLTLDRNLQGPDHAVSLTPHLFAEYVRSAHNAWSMMGEPRERVSELEADVRAVARKSVVAKAAIRKGETITSQMLTLKRPGGGLEPRQLEALIGKIAERDIPAETQIDWTMVV